MDGEGFITDDGLFQQVGPGTGSTSAPTRPSFGTATQNRYPGHEDGVVGGSGGPMDPHPQQQGWDTTYTAGDINGSAGLPPVLAGVSDAGTFVLSETALTMHCWGENPVVTAKLQLNGQDRFSEREGTYFDLVQPYQHHTRNPDTGINVYSFALRPEEHQPSGTCNFSRIDNATLQLILSNATVEGTKTAKVRVYATNYNVLRIMSGMGKFNLIYFLLAFWVHLGYVCAIKTALKSNLPPTNRFCRGTKQLVSYPVHYGRQTITSPLISCY